MPRPQLTVALSRWLYRWSLGAASVAAADAVYVNGYIYTVDPHESVQEALAVRGGRIAYVGTSAGARALADSATPVIDLKGRTVMPGLVDGHMHPLDGGKVLLKCNLNYERLTVAQMQSRIQTCLDQTTGRAGQMARSRQLVSRGDATEWGCYHTRDARRAENPPSDLRDVFIRPYRARQHASPATWRRLPPTRPIRLAEDRTRNVWGPSGILEDAAFRT